MTETQIHLLEALGRHKTHWIKFFRDIEYWEWKAVLRVKLLGLTDGPELVIWDIGCGVPYFAAAAQKYGHSVQSLDYQSHYTDKVLTEAAAILDVPYTDAQIVEGEPLPPEIGICDLITMCGVNLKRKDGPFWGWPEYEQFALSVLSRLTPGGSWFLLPNRGPEVDFILDAARWKEVLGVRATLVEAGSAVVITKQE